MQDIEYTQRRTRANGEKIECVNTVESWISSALDEGGIEDHISKLRQLVALLAADWLERNPTMLSEVANAIDCDGYNHRLIPAQESGN